MKNLLVILLLLPLSVFPQTERDQKLSFRNRTKTTQTTNTEQSEKTTIRRTEIDRRNTPTNTPIFYGPSYYDYHRFDWIRWGAPIHGYSGFYPFYYYDRFGFRQPARIYTYENGKKDTIRGERQHIRLGLSFNTDNQIGGWFTYGNKRFFILEYSSYLSNDRSTYLSDLTMDIVIPWNDQRLEDITKGGVIYAGGGYKLNRFGFYIMPGYGWERNNFQFFDEFYVLSNNGKYSFPNYKENYFTGKVGVIYDYKFLTTKVDYNPFRNIINLGVGFVL